MSEIFSAAFPMQADALLYKMQPPVADVLRVVDRMAQQFAV